MRADSQSESNQNIDDGKAASVFAIVPPLKHHVATAICSRQRAHRFRAEVGHHRFDDRANRCALKMFGFENDLCKIVFRTMVSE